MFTLIVGSDLNLLNSQIDNQLKKYNSENIKIYKELNNVSDLYYLTLQTNLFFDPEVYVVYHDEFFSSLECFKVNEEWLLKLLESNKDFIFVSRNKISTSSKINNFIKNVNFIEVKGINYKNKSEYINFVLKENNIHISELYLNLISNKLPNDANIIKNEISKLKHYNEIDETIISNLICDYQQANILELIKFILLKDYQKVFELYESIVDQNYDTISIIQILSTQLINLILFMKLKQNKYSKNEINNSLNLTYFTYQINDNLSKLTSIDKLNNIANELYILDLKIKNNLLDKDNIFRFFLIKLIK